MRPTVATGWRCCIRAAWWPRARPRTCARASAEMWWCCRRRTAPMPRSYAAGSAADGADAAELCRWIETRFGLKPSVVDGSLRVEIANGHRFITEVVEAFPGAIDSVGLHKPHLEDVFVRETGALIE